MSKKGTAGPDFSKDYALWLVVSHFLSAPDVAHLAAASIRETSGGSLSLDELCEHYLTPGPPVLASWIIRLSDVDGRMAHFCQNLARALAWQSDVDLYVSDKDLPPGEFERMRLASAAIDLSQRDLGTIRWWESSAGRAWTELKPLAESIALLAGGGGRQSEIDALLSPLGKPLQLVAYKHLGDLCADVDRAADARLLYERALEVDCTSLDCGWGPLVSAVRDMAIQSRAAMLWMEHGPQAALPLLDPVLRSEDRIGLLSGIALNGAIDAMRARNLASDDWIASNDVRPATLIAPQVASQHDLEMAQYYWAEHKFENAHRRFWGSIRRRRALGSATATQEAMAEYARALVDELGVRIASKRDNGQFQMAVDLMLASGRSAAVGTEFSNADVIEAYLTAEAAGRALETAHRYRGMRAERTLVLISLFETWVLGLKPDREELTVQLLNHLAQIARDEPWSFVADKDIARKAFDALARIAVKRPELRLLLSGPVADAILARADAPEVLLRSKALETADRFIGGLEPEDTFRIVEAALGQLEAKDPDDADWLASRPAINIISDPAARRLWSSHPSLAERSAHQLLAYGTKTQGFTGALMACFDELEPYARDLIAGSAELDEAILRQRQRAHQLNNSGTIGDIVSLLHAPRLAGREGLEDAVGGLIELLGTASAPHPSISLSQADHALRAIAHGYADISLVWGDDVHAALALQLRTALKCFWAEATKRPQLFVHFSIPPKEAPDPVLIHNWAYASLGFGRATGLADDIDVILSEASSNAILGPSISLARASRLTEQDSRDFDFSRISQEGESQFYAALGSRLAYLGSQKPATHDQILRLLLARCLKLGPNLLDAAIMVQARTHGIMLDDDKRLRDSYAMKMEGNAMLRRTLSPLLASLDDRTDS